MLLVWNMNLSEFKSAFRTRTHDLAEKKLWSDAEIKLYLNEAQNEAATRALLIQDESTPAVCEIDLEVASGTYPLHSSVLEITRGTLSDNTILHMTSREELDDVWENWETATGTPKFLLETGDGNVLVIPIPTSTDTLTLTVRRLPLDSLDENDDEPEIHEKYHYRMLDWALRCAYLKQDAETLDRTRAESYEASFERSFGHYHDANVQRKQRDKHPRIVKSSW